MEIPVIDVTEPILNNDYLLAMIQRLDIVINGMQLIYNGLMFFVVLAVVSVIIYLLAKFVLGWFTF